MPEEYVQDTGVEEVPAAGEQEVDQQTEETTETKTTETGVEEKEQVAAAGVEDKTEQAFAKRLAAEREKIERHYSPYTSLIQREAQRYGMTPEQYVQAVEQQQREQQAQVYAEEHGISPELAKEQLLLRQEVQALKQSAYMNEAKTRNLQQKAELQSKRFFKELEPEVDRLIAANPKVDVATAFKFLRGERFDELVESERKAAEKKVMEDLKTKQKGGVTPGTAKTVTQKAQHGSIKDALLAYAEELDL